MRGMREVQVLRLPRRVVGDAGNAVELALVRHRHRGFRGVSGHHQADPVFKDEFRGHLGGAVGVGLGILVYDFQVIGL